MRLPLLVLMLAALLALPASADAQVQTFRKEVRQVIGSAQSPDDARAAAVAKAKRDAVEEAGTWLESLSEVQNYALARDDVTALASGIVHTRIVEEQRFVEGDAFGIRVVAEVRVDNSGLAERIRAFLADRQRLAEARANVGREQELLARLAELERRMAAMQNATESEKAALRGDVQSNAQQLTAWEWFDQGYALWDAQRNRYADPNQAIAYFSVALRLDSNFAAAYNNRGLAYLELRQYERAIRDYDQALRLDPKFAVAYNNRGFAYRDLKQYERAIQDYDQALRVDPNNAIAYDNRGIAYAKLGQYVRAIQDFDQALRRDPDKANAYNNRGLAYLELRQYERAVRDFDQALRLNPNYALGYNNRGLAYVKLGQHERAIHDYDQAVRLDPNDAVAYYNRGNAYHYLKQYERAIQDYDQALRLDPDYALGYNNRAIARARLGQRALAYQDFRKACDLGQQIACDNIRKNPE